MLTDSAAHTSDSDLGRDAVPDREVRITYS